MVELKIIIPIALMAVLLLGTRIATTPNSDS